MVAAVGVLAQGDVPDGAPWWLTVVLAVLALIGGGLSAVLARRSARESTAIAELTARLSHRGALEANNTAALTRIDGRLAALELEKWRRREETMRMLRWAAENAANQDNDTLARVGVAALDALGGSELLQSEDQAFIDNILDAILEQPVAQYHDTSGQVDVVQHQEGA